VSFPAGPAGSHQILNGATEPALGSIAAIPTTSRTSGGQVENDQVDVEVMPIEAKRVPVVLGDELEAFALGHLKPFGHRLLNGV